MAETSFPKSSIKVLLLENIHPIAVEAFRAEGFQVELLKSALPTAIEELRGAAERGWVGVDDAIKIAAEKRLAAFYSGLDASRQALLRDWLFYLHYRASTRWPKDAKDDDARAANLVWGAFHPYPGFLEWMLATVANVEFGAHPLPPSVNAQSVDAIKRPAPGRTVKVGAGKVTA